VGLPDLLNLETLVKLERHRKGDPHHDDVHAALSKGERPSRTRDMVVATEPRLPGIGAERGQEGRLEVAQVTLLGVGEHQCPGRS
jgi:hypothetical protein